MQFCDSYCFNVESHDIKVENLASTLKDILLASYVGETATYIRMYEARPFN